MLALFASTLAFSPAVRVVAPSRASAKMETVADLKDLAKKCNPTIGFWDPLGLADAVDIGWLRQAEIKHGRVAMAAFVGFIVGSNNIVWPWALTGGPLSSGDSILHSQIAAAGGPGDQWDALPSGSKMQILIFVGLLEALSEHTPTLEAQGQKHYMRGGKPGFMPSLKALDLPHPVPLDLWDPFGFTKKMSPERKEKALVAEINNGRLAMIGIMGFVSASKGLIVPGMDGIGGIKPYAGEYMAAFSDNNANLPFVPEMLQISSTWDFTNLVKGLY